MGWLPQSVPFVGFDLLLRPQIAITTTNTLTTSTQQPALLRFQPTGRDIEEVVLLVGQETDSGRRLFTYDPLIPEPNYLPSGERLYTWRDGLHEDFYVWQSRAPFWAMATLVCSLCCGRATVTRLPCARSRVNSSLPMVPRLLWLI
ncbi:MAG: hypothetical protein IPL28_02445 [Chloroflexi bacterium]|nr:hypothetical protein [Chloroflexota bacterium]